MPTAQPPRKRQRMPDVVPASDDDEEDDKKLALNAPRSVRGRRSSGAQAMARPKTKSSTLPKSTSSTTTTSISKASTPASSSRLTRPSSTVLSASRTRDTARPSSSSSVLSPRSSSPATAEDPLQPRKRMSLRKPAVGATESIENTDDVNRKKAFPSTARKPSKPSSRQSTIASLKPTSKPPAKVVSSKRQSLQPRNSFFHGASQDRYWSAGSFNSRAASVASHDDVFDAIEDDEDDEDEHQDPRKEIETGVNSSSDLHHVSDDRIGITAVAGNTSVDVNDVSDEFFTDDDDNPDPTNNVQAGVNAGGDLRHIGDDRNGKAAVTENKPTFTNDVNASDGLLDEFFDDDEDIYNEICSQQPRDDGPTAAVSKDTDTKPRPDQSTNIGQRTNTRVYRDNSHGHSARSTPVPLPAAGSVGTSLAKRFFWPSVPGSTPSSQLGSLATPTSSALETSGRPWADQYPPLNLQELVVHKRKVADVQNWLASVFVGRIKQRILVLRGPAGSGKTSTVSLLSGVLGYDIVEWKQPLGADYHNSMSMGAHFEDFLSRGDKFGTLDTDINPSTNHLGVHDHRVLLIEEFPSFMSSSSSGLRSFRTSLERYLATAHDGTYPGPPIIIIVSETMLGSANGPLDGFTVHKLLGPDLINHSALGIIDFNAIAPTFMLKALELVVRKDARIHQRKLVPTTVLKQFCDSGDIRSAISALEFLCRQTAPPTKRAASGRGKIATSSSWEKETLQTITQRENSLGLFHAAGKVMYNKRDNPADVSPSQPLLPPPPPHFSHYSRPFVSQVSVDDILNETGTDVSTFLAALHENYVPSCNSDSFVTHLDDSAEYLSNSDVLCSSSAMENNVSGAQSRFGGRPKTHMGANASLDMLRQDEIAFHVGVRGLLFALPYPVHRQAQAHKLFYPTSMKLWRKTEEMAGMMEAWIRRSRDPDLAMDGGSLASGGGRKGRKVYGVESWRSARYERQEHPSRDEDGATQEAHLSRPLISRDDVLLDRLPYLRYITTSKRNTTPTTTGAPQLHLSSASVDNLKLLTQFNRFGVGRSTQPEEDLDFDINDETTPFTPSTSLIDSKPLGADEHIAPEEDNLVLEDDDIEED